MSKDTIHDGSTGAANNPASSVSIQMSPRSLMVKLTFLALALQCSLPTHPMTSTMFLPLQYDHLCFQPAQQLQD